MPFSCFTLSEILDKDSSWSSDGKVAVLGVFNGGRCGLAEGILKMNEQRCRKKKERAGYKNQRI